MTRWFTGRLRPEAHGPRRTLLAALGELLEDGKRTPCQIDPDPFTSEHRDDRAEAADACAGCPVRGHCDAYADSQQETWGVWAGQDRTPTPRPTTHPRGTT